MTYTDKPLETSPMPGNYAFSESVGLVSPRNVIQVDSMDAALRNRLWDFVKAAFLTDANERLTDIAHHGTYQGVWVSFFEQSLDEVPWGSGDATAELRKWFYREDWNRVYDLVTFLMRNGRRNVRDDAAVDQALNAILEGYLSAYRWVGYSFVPIVDDEQIRAIETALETPLASARGHLNKALRLLSEREHPDAANSIKESISAVEAICSAIVGKPTTLGDALSKLKSANLTIHPALEEGWKRIYGYTSDANGIRHAVRGESNLSVDDALYFMVSCSAFVSLLASKAKSVGVTLS